jgi:hypothetical protein
VRSGLRECSSMRKSELLAALKEQKALPRVPVRIMFLFRIVTYRETI